MLQYGSALFEADTDTSDFDLLMVITYCSMDTNQTDISVIRKEFFFGQFAEKLKARDDFMVFSAENARNPQLKIIIDNELYVDLSCAIVSNRDFSGMMLG